MPPKGKKGGEKPKENKPKVDKTFGMPNQKGAKAKKQIALIKSQEAAAGKNKDVKTKDKEREQANKAKASEVEHKKATADLFAQVPQKIPFGVDPKSVVCQYHKAGFCEKGRKCKFSHDLNVNRKGEKADLYTDSRLDKKDDLMEYWDEAKLKEVVLSKHGNPKSTTDIVCMHFLGAIENQKYGWFWTCPNGTSCKYKHALPPGFVLKPKGKKKEEGADANSISIEEFLEVERHKLPAKLTPVTPESFAEWKKNRQDKKAAEQDAINKSKQTQVAAGKAGGMSGRDLFEFNPELYNDSDEEDGEDDEWDLAAIRKRAEDERDEQERKRIAMLGGNPDAEAPAPAPAEPPGAA